MSTRVITVAALGFAFLPAPQARAQSAEIRVFASNGVKAVVEDLRAQSEKALGRPLVIQFDSTAALKRRMDAGEAFDVALLTSDVMDDLIKQGKMLAATRADLSRTGVGIGIRRGAAKPDIATSDALKRALRSVKSITYASEGASRVYIAQAFDRLGITEEMKLKTSLQPASGPATALVAEGKTDLVITLISEIMPVPGIELLGPFPAELQHYVSFAAAVSAHAKNPEAAKALIKFLTAPAAAPVFKAKGMQTT